MDQIVPAPPLPDFGISPEDFNIVAKDAGFTTINARVLASSAVVGQAVKALGAVKIGRSKLLIADEQMDMTFNYCKTLLDPSNPITVEMEMRDRIDVLKTMSTLAHSRGRNAQRMIESAQVDMSDGSKPQGIAASFLPGQRVVPSAAVQININSPSKK